MKGFISPNEKPSIPSLIYQERSISDSQEKANLLNEFFTEQTILNDDNVPIPDISYTNSSMPSFTVSPHEVQSVLLSLTLGKASGPDEINNRVLRELSNVLSVPLCELFNKSLTEGVVPTSWKKAHVCAVYKKGDPSLVSNYRPISLLSNLNKVLERIVFKYVFNYLRDIDFLSPFQSGFVPGDSTINQLIYLYNEFCRSLDEGKEIRTVFFDISKAFDRVWHAGLIGKLKAAGISNSLVNWFSNYLIGRRQRVVIPGAQSTWSSIKAGVPQGSIL